MLRQRYLERRLGRLVVLCGAAILLAGCFDVQLGINLHNDGSGAVTTRIILSKEMTDMAAAGRSKPMPALLGKDNRNVRTTSEIRNGQLVTEETVGFAHLSDVPLSDDNIEVTNLGRTFFGAARSRIRWSLGSTHNDPNAAPIVLGSWASGLATAQVILKSKSGNWSVPGPTPGVTISAAGAKQSGAIMTNQWTPICYALAALLAMVIGCRSLGKHDDSGFAMTRLAVGTSEV